MTSMPITLFESPNLKKSVHALALMPDATPLNLTEVERKIFNVMLKLSMESAKTHRPDGNQWFSSSLKEISRRCVQTQTIRTEFYKNACKNLMRVVLEFQSPSESDNNTETGKALSVIRLRHLVEAVDFETRGRETIVFWQFNLDVEPFLLNPERFAVLRIESIAALGSAASIVLYEICARYAKTESGSTGWKPWQWWVSALTGMPTTGPKRSKTYDEYRYFNNFVLKPSILEVNEKTEINVELQVQKAGRTVVEIRFLATRKNNRPQMPAKALRADEPQDQQLVQLVEKAALVDVSSSDVEKLLKKFPLPSVNQALDGLSAALTERKDMEPIRSNRAYLKGVLERMYGVPKGGKGPSTVKIPTKKTRLSSPDDSKSVVEVVNKSDLQKKYEALPSSKKQMFVDRAISRIEARVRGSGVSSAMDKMALAALQNNAIKPVIGLYLAPVLKEYQMSIESKDGTRHE